MKDVRIECAADATDYVEVGMFGDSVFIRTEGGATKMRGPRVMLDDDGINRLIQGLKKARKERRGAV